MMKKILLVGRTHCGKTTLSQAITGNELKYDKTQYIKQTEKYIDTPGEYVETKVFGGALALYSYESDVIGLVQDACEPFSLFAPSIAPLANRPVIGIITKIDRSDARPDMAEEWLKLAGAEPIFHISSKTGEGIDALISYLNEDD